MQSPMVFHAPPCHDLVQRGMANGDLGGKRAGEVVLLHQPVDLFSRGEPFESCGQIQATMGHRHGELKGDPLRVQLFGSLARRRLLSTLSRAILDDRSLDATSHSALSPVQ